MKARLRRLRALAGAAGGVSRELAAVPREARRHAPRPPADGLVLEIGSGQAPHPRADVVVDKYVADSFERASEAALDMSKPLVVADGHRLPFDDGIFAYSLAIHVLEHAVDPASFAAELVRVSAAGFVQVPTAKAELTFGWPYHPWLIERSDDTLVFRAKGSQRAAYGAEFHVTFAESPLFRLWWASNRSRWLHSLEWRGTLNVQVDGASAADHTAMFDLDETVAVLEHASKSRQVRRLPEPVRRSIRCPVCRGPLVTAARTIACSECARCYPVAGTVPILLAEAASG